MTREVFSVKIKAKLKKEFTDVIKEKGFSTCFIIETLLTAWLEGLKASARSKVDQSKTITVVQNFTRVIKRARRGTSGFLDPYSEMKEANFYNGKTTCWEYRPGPCNLNGHAASCACSICREIKKGEISVSEGGQSVIQR